MMRMAPAAGKQDPKGHQMVIRMKRMFGTRDVRGHYEISEPRSEHFKRTLLYAGVAIIAALCVYFLAHSEYEQHDNERGTATSAVPQHP